MTQADLQAFLVKDLTTYLKDNRHYNSNKELKSLNVYYQDLPKDNIYEETEQFDYFPFVIVEIPDGAIAAFNEPHIVNVNFAVGTVEPEGENCGHFAVFNIINKILEYLTENSSFNKKYTLNYPLKWSVKPDENAEPYYYGVIEASFVIPAITNYIKQEP